MTRYWMLIGACGYRVSSRATGVAMCHPEAAKAAEGSQAMAPGQVVGLGWPVPVAWGPSRGLGRHGGLRHPEDAIAVEGSQAMAPGQAIVAGYLVPVA